MEQLRIPFEVLDPGDVEETESGRPEDVVKSNALAKAVKVAGVQEEGIIIGADTVVVSQGKILGKPRSSSEAKEMLMSLRGSVHTVLTGLALVDARSGRKESDVVKTRVWMADLSEEEIKGYVETEESLGKAGGYAIQGLGAILIDEIQGCFYNVVGLPLSRLVTLLKRFGVHTLKKFGDSS